MESTRKGFLPMMIVMVLVGGLLLREPDFGAFVVITLSLLVYEYEALNLDVLALFLE